MYNTKLQIFKHDELGISVRAIFNDDGSISVNAEDAARGLGFTQIAKSGNETIRWERINTYLSSFGASPKVGMDDYLPESLFYLLSMKATNENARKFQVWVAKDVLPEIRKTGGYNADNQVHIDPDQFASALTAIHTLTEGLPNRYEAIQALVKPLGVTLPSQTETPADTTLTGVTGKTNRTRYGVREFVNDRGMGFITAHTVDKVFNTYFAYAALHDHDPLSFTDFSYELKNIYKLDQYTRYGDDKRALGRYYVPR